MQGLNFNLLVEGALAQGKMMAADASLYPGTNDLTTFGITDNNLQHY